MLYNTVTSTVTGGIFRALIYRELTEQINTGSFSRLVVQKDPAKKETLFCKSTLQICCQACRGLVGCRQRDALPDEKRTEMTNDAAEAGHSLFTP